MKTRRRLITLLGALSPIILLFALASPANATDYGYQLVNVYNGRCLTEDGTTGAIYMQACGNASATNPSQLWTIGIWGQLINDHSQLCLIVTGSDTDVWLTGGSACTTNTSVAEWNHNEYEEFTNGHTGWYLDDDISNGIIIQTKSIINGIHWRESSAHS
jgi:Ricin-type beta-trefoil lectin domain-like